MELVMGIAADELWLGCHVDCPEEDCAYALRGGVLWRHELRTGPEVDGGRRGGPAVAVDPEVDVAEAERPRMRRIIRMLSESAATARLASAYVVFVPRDGDLATAGIHPRSGIVGAPVPGAEQVVVYYEGGIYGQVGMERLADRVLHAHRRLVEGYPTIARMSVPRASLLEVGTFEPFDSTITPIDAASEKALAGWIGTEVLDPAELVPGGGAL